MKKSKPEEYWEGNFGTEYTNRNNLSITELNKLYIKKYGLSRSILNAEFLSKAAFNKDPSELKFLEVGCNVGNQLNIIDSFDYKNLWGIDISKHALKIARQRGNFNIVNGNVLDIPFKDNFFDMVFTSGLLIHIPPHKIHEALDEIYRCTSKYIWGFEYYHARDFKEVKYRDENNLMWKANYPQLFLDRFNNLELVHKKLLKYSDNEDIDVMYLLRKN